MACREHRFGARENSFSEDVPYFIPRFCDAITEIVDTLAIERFQVMVRPPTALRRFFFEAMAEKTD
jgi:hypothetical protein